MNVGYGTQQIAENGPKHLHATTFPCNFHHLLATNHLTRPPRPRSPRKAPPASRYRLDSISNSTCGILQSFATQALSSYIGTLPSIRSHNTSRHSRLIPKWPVMAEQSINIPQVLVFIVVTFLAVRWYFSKPGATGTRAAPSRTAPRINLAQLDQIAQMFPQASRRDIAWDLQRNGGNPAATTERLLSGRGLDAVRTQPLIITCQTYLKTPLLITYRLLLRSTSQLPAPLRHQLGRRRPLQNNHILI